MTFLDNLVSIVIPFYKAEETIETCLDSVLYQTIMASEIVIVVDGCDDYTLREICKKDKYKLLKFKIINIRKNSGPSVARNLGIENSNSEFIAFLDADDCWHQRKLELQTKVMLDKNIDFLCHKYDFFGLKTFYSGFSLIKIKRYNLAFRTYIFTPTVMVKKNKFIGFPVDLKHSEDYYCWLSNIGSDFYLMDCYLANGHKKPIGESGLSSNIYEMHKGFINANLKLLKEKKISLFYFILCMFLEYLKFPVRYLR